MPTREIVITELIQTVEDKVFNDCTFNSPTIGNVQGIMTLLGGAIKFPAIHIPSADPNAFDDYEEFDWTPSLGGNATYTNRTGKGIKVGRIVMFEMEMTINVLGTGSSYQISGLPVPSLGFSNPVPVLASGGLSHVSACAITDTVPLISCLHKTASAVNWLSGGLFTNGSFVSVAGFYISQD